MINGDQCRMARAALRWSAAELGKVAGVGLSTVQRFERGGGLQGRNLAAIQKAFEEAGIQFIPENGGGVGVRLRDRED